MTELAGLYARYKRLALAVGAGLLLDDGAHLGAETLLLAADAGHAREACGPSSRDAAATACHEAALALHRLVVADSRDDDHAALIARVRTTHRALRVELWDEVADQYAPCGAHPHRHTLEHDHV